jgi:hypothetical protein
MNMLTDRGFDLAVSTVDGSERKVLSIVQRIRKIRTVEAYRQN